MITPEEEFSTIEIGQRIKNYRERAGLTEIEMAKRFFGNSPITKSGETVQSLLADGGRYGYKMVLEKWRMVENGQKKRGKVSSAHHDLPSLFKICSILGISFDTLLHGDYLSGDVIYWKADRDVKANELVTIGSIVGITREETRKGYIVLCYTTGVYALPAREGIEQFETVYLENGSVITWDSSEMHRVGTAWSDSYFNDGKCLVDVSINK